MLKLPDQVYVIGAGGHGKVAVRAAQQCGMHVIAVFDDDLRKLGQYLCGVPIVGDVRSLAQHKVLPTLIAIGDNSRRLSLAEDLKLPWATIVHPDATVDSHRRIGAGTLVLAGAVVQVDATIGEHAIVNNNATVEHDCYVGSGAHISSNACVAGGARIGNQVMVGAGAVVLPKIKVGDFATIGAGAVVTRDVPSHVTAVGVPARLLPHALKPADRAAHCQSSSNNNVVFDAAS